MKYDAGNNMDDQLAILEARTTHLWNRYCAPESGYDKSLYEDSLMFRRDLELLEQDYCISQTGWRRNSGDFSADQFLQASEKIQDQWCKIRLETCRVVVLRIEAKYCGIQSQNGDPLPVFGAAQATIILSSTRHQLCASAASALEVVEGFRLSEVPVVSAALCLAVPLYVIATALIDESYGKPFQAELESEQYRGSSELLETQIAYAMEMLKHLYDTAGDQNSLRLLSSVKKRQCKGKESFLDGLGALAEQDFSLHVIST